MFAKDERYIIEDEDGSRWEGQYLARLSGSSGLHLILTSEGVGEVVHKDNIHELPMPTTDAEIIQWVIDNTLWESWHVKKSVGAPMLYNRLVRALRLVADREARRQ